MQKMTPSRPVVQAAGALPHQQHAHGGKWAAACSAGRYLRHSAWGSNASQKVCMPHDSQSGTLRGHWHALQVQVLTGMHHGSRYQACRWWATRASASAGTRHPRLALLKVMHHRHSQRPMGTPHMLLHQTGMPYRKPSLVFCPETQASISPMSACTAVNCALADMQRKMTRKLTGGVSDPLALLMWWFSCRWHSGACACRNVPVDGHRSFRGSSRPRRGSPHAWHSRCCNGRESGHTRRCMPDSLVLSCFY